MSLAIAPRSPKDRGEKSRLQKICRTRVSRCAEEHNVYGNSPTSIETRYNQDLGKAMRNYFNAR